jgi:hypothetical protein
MRNAELLLVSSNKHSIQDILKTICKELFEDNDEMIFGFLPIDDQLQLNLYGIEWKENAETYFWEGICRKVLGIIVIFDWQDDFSVSSMKQILHFFETRFEIPIMTASTLNGSIEDLPVQLYRGGLPVTKDSRFTFYNLKTPASVRELIVGLININLETMSRE